MIDDRNITLSDLKFIARKIEFWLALAAAGALGLLFGLLL